MLSAPGLLCLATAWLAAAALAQTGTPLSFLDPSNFNSSDTQPFRKSIDESVCATGWQTSFVRVLHGVRMGVPTIATTATLAQCASYCRQDVEPLSGGKRACRGFNHQASEQQPSCELFDVTARGHSINTRVGPRTYYLQKVCLQVPDDEACLARPYAFTVAPDTRLHGQVHLSVTVKDAQHCLSLCLTTTDFICRSVNYDRSSRQCSLLSRDRVMGAHAETIQPGMDYYENNCLSNSHRCDDGTIHFVKVARTQVLGADAAQRPQSLHACLNRCLLTDDMYCRSVEYSPATNQCSLSDEDSISSPNSIVTSNYSNVDWYEPVCIQGAARIHCQSPYLYERVPLMVMALPANTSPLHTLANVTVDNCMLRCLQHDECKSFNHDRDAVMCDLLPVDRSQIGAGQPQTELLDSRTSDYYEVMCPERTGQHHDLRSEQGVLPAQAAPNFPASPQPQLMHHHKKSLRESSAEHAQHAVDDNNIKKKLDELPEAAFNADGKFFDFHREEETEEVLQRAQRATDGLQEPRSLPFDRDDSEDRASRRPRQSDKCGFEMKASRRTLKAFYRNDHPRIRSLEACQLMCESWRTFVCRSASYSQASNLCSLSQLDLSDFGLAELTQYDPDYDFFIRNDCSGNGGLGERQASNSVLELLSSSNGTDKQQQQQQQQQASKADTAGHNRVDSTAAVPTEQQHQETAEAVDVQAQGQRDARVQQGRSQHNRISSSISLPQPADFLGAGSQFGSERLASQLDGSRSFNSIADEFAGSSPQRLNAVDGNGGGISVDDVLISADCMPSGVNVTVILPNQLYTGAIYAAERFSFCRTRVTARSAFSLFLQRPSVSSDCNTVELNEIMSAVVIISNDRVLPYDVTTKDDLFYEISCDYSGANLQHLREGVLVRGGIVVGGPTPRVVAATANNALRDVDVTMRILREGKSVQNVLLGEKLTLSIRSGVPAERMEIDSCNVTRIGGSGPSPEPLNLLRNGCPVMEQVLGTVRRADTGLESPLTAFRIDGSAEIQIVCLVKFCATECPLPLCEPQLHTNRRRLRDASSYYNTIETKAQPISEQQPGADSDQLAVDGILRVYVPGEIGAPNLHDSAIEPPYYDDLFNEAGKRTGPIGRPIPRGDCISRGLFMAVCATLGTLLLATLLAVGAVMYYRSMMSASGHKMMADTRPTSVGTGCSQANGYSGHSDRYRNRPGKTSREHLM